MGRNLNPEGKARLDSILLATYGDPATGIAPCVWCGVDLDIAAGDHERDRMVPGGAYSAENVGPACGPCNADRGDRTDGEWSVEHRTVRAPVTVSPDVWRALLSERRRARARAHREAAARRAARRG